jgi:hypothetical protein
LKARLALAQCRRLVFSAPGVLSVSESVAPPRTDFGGLSSLAPVSTSAAVVAPPVLISAVADGAVLASFPSSRPSDSAAPPSFVPVSAAAALVAVDGTSTSSAVVLTSLPLFARSTDSAAPPSFAPVSTPAGNPSSLISASPVSISAAADGTSTLSAGGVASFPLSTVDADLPAAVRVVLPHGDEVEVSDDTDRMDVDFEDDPLGEDVMDWDDGVYGDDMDYVSETERGGVPDDSYARRAEIYEPFYFRAGM